MLAFDGRLGHLVAPALAGLAALTAGIAGFVLVQHAQPFARLSRVLAGLLPRAEALHGSATELDDLVHAPWRRPLRLAASLGLGLAALVLQTAEVWVASRVLGVPLGIGEAALLKSLTVTLANVAFVVPNAYGLQEGAYLVLGPIVGLSPEAALALALAVRCRGLLIDLPGVAGWSVVEARRRHR
jgi:hypothetical protein